MLLLTQQNIINELIQNQSCLKPISRITLKCSVFLCSFSWKFDMSTTFVV